MSKAVAPSNVPASKDALLKSYRKRLKEDVTSMASNFQEIVKLCKVEEETQIGRATQCEEDAFEMQVRAANMVSQTVIINLSKSPNLMLFLGPSRRITDEVDKRHQAVPDLERLPLRERSHRAQLENVPQSPGSL